MLERPHERAPWKKPPNDSFLSVNLICMAAVLSCSKEIFEPRYSNKTTEYSVTKHSHTVGDRKMTLSINVNLVLNLTKTNSKGPKIPEIYCGALEFKICSFQLNN